MKATYFRAVWLIVFTVALASCATAPSSAPIPVPAGHAYKGSYINVRAPESKGWYLVRSTPAGIEFARRGQEPDESFGAQVLMFPLARTQTRDAFVALIKTSYMEDTDTDRFRIIKLNFRYSGRRKYPCVDVASVVEDKRAQIGPGRRADLILQSKALYCRHPVREDTGFSIIYSHRGKAIDASLNAEAKDFIDGVQVPGH